MNWTVEPCPNHGGKHPLHDNRLIVSPPAHPGGTPSIVAKMTDIEKQAELARLISAAPELLSALRGIDALYNRGAFGGGDSEDLDVDACREAMATARLAMFKASGVLTVTD